MLLADLQELELDDVVLSDRTTTSRYNPFFTILRSLTSLDLHDTKFDQATAPHFLCRTTMPNLRALKLDGCSLIDEPASMRPLGQFAPGQVAEDLEHLILGGAELSMTPDNSAADLVAKCLKLRTVSAPVWALTTNFIDGLPNSLEQLSVYVPQSGNVTAERRASLAEQSLAASLALSNAFLDLSTLPTNATPQTPGVGSYFYLSSPSSLGASLLSTVPTTPVEWTWATPPSMPSPLGTLASSSSPLPSTTSNLSQLARLRLPLEWQEFSTQVAASAATQPRDKGEMSWALQRIERVCDRREIDLRYM